MDPHVKGGTSASRVVPVTGPDRGFGLQDDDPLSVLDAVLGRIYRIVKRAVMQTFRRGHGRIILIGAVIPVEGGLAPSR